jgi:ribosomal protein S18 acetylase RimI-like enzyme
MLEMLYSLGSLTEHVESKNHVFLLAKEGDEALGFASYELNYSQQSKTKIHKIYILPSSQGMGIGKLLINRIIEIARSIGNEFLSLNVNRNNKAVEVYKKLGFEIIKEEDIDIGNGFYMNDFVMEKSIKIR